MDARTRIRKKFFLRVTKKGSCGGHIWGNVKNYPYSLFSNFVWILCCFFRGKVLNSKKWTNVPTWFVNENKMTHFWCQKDSFEHECPITEINIKLIIPYSALSCFVRWQKQLLSGHTHLCPFDESHVITLLIDSQMKKNNLLAWTKDGLHLWRSQSKARNRETLFFF